MSDETEPPIDVGAIQPEKPLFTIIKRGAMVLVDSETGAGVRPCRHPRYILDDEWLTVTCAECKERLEPYAVIRFNAAVLETIKRERQHKEIAEEQMLAVSCREMLRRSCFTEEERERLGRRTYMFGSASSLKYIRELHKTLTDRVRAAKAARRARKRSP